MHSNEPRTKIVKCTHYLRTSVCNYFCVDGRMEVGNYWLIVFAAIPDRMVGGVYPSPIVVTIRGDVCVERVGHEIEIFCDTPPPPNTIAD